MKPSNDFLGITLQAEGIKTKQKKCNYITLKCFRWQK